MVRATLVQDVHPHQSANDVEAKVLALLGPNGRIDKVTVVPSLSDVSAIEPQAGRPVGAGIDPNAGAVWIVRGHGVFTAEFTPPGAAPAHSPTGGGYYLVDDVTGEILGTGWP
jgi:hypothetical protein